jgi:hypothetical protein
LTCPGFGAVSPSAIVEITGGGVGVPAASDRTMPSAPSGCTPTISTWDPSVRAARIAPAISPPPEHGTSIRVSSGWSSRNSRVAVAAPATTIGSSKGCTNVYPCSAVRASAAWNASAAFVMPSLTTVAPCALTARSFSGTALDGITTVSFAPSSRAAYAAPSAALPALTVMRPASSASRESVRTRFSAPRSLNDPVCWRHSAFATTGPPASRSSASDRRTGVRTTRPRSASLAARASASVGSAGIRRQAPNLRCRAA